MRRWLFTGLLAALIASAAGGARAGSASAPAIPRREMPETVCQVLRQALESFGEDDRRKDDWLERNAEALRHLRKLPWPDLDKTRLGRLYSAKRPEQFITAWYLPAGEDELVVLLPNFTETRLPRQNVAKLEERQYADELSALIEYLDRRDPEARRPWDFTYIQDFGAAGLPHYGGVFLLHHAYAAASLGRTEEAARLVHEALKQRRLCFEHTYNEAAWQSFAQGIAMLEAGKPRREVLEHWQETLRVYGHSRYRDQLTDLVGQLEKQVVEDGPVAATEVEDPEKLPLPERIDYYVARLPEVHGAQWSQPGHCMTYGMGKATKASDALIKIGRPAVPKLIEHLEDRRLTRSIGFWRNFAPSRTVLRVQDVAVQCIEQIVDIRFYHPSSTSSYLSNEEEEKRRAVIDDIKQWWKQNGSKTPLEGYLARLDRGSIYDRLEILRKVESIDRQAVDSIATLKRWAAGVDFRQLPRLARALADRGDMSLLSAMRKMAQDPVREIPHECVWFLLKHGNADDYRFLREAAREDIRRGATLGSSRIWGAVKAGIEGTDNPLAVPILVDLLDRREITGSRWISQEQGSMGFSCADTCIATLIKLTGHDPGYRPGDPVEKRYAAVDRWKAWWEREGQAAYLNKHPEVNKVLGEAPRAVEQLDAAALPGLVEVAGANPEAPIVYRVPREDIEKLAQAGEILVQGSGPDDWQFRFASAEAAAEWFAEARPLPGKQDGQMQEILQPLATVQSVDGVTIGPDGRAWLCSRSQRVAVAEVKKQVEQAAAAEAPRISGAEVLLVDRQGRVWLTPSEDRKLLLGFDPRQKEWIQRHGPTPDQQTAYKDQDPEVIKHMITGPAYESAAGRIYFGDRRGVQVFDHGRWHYQALYQRNFKENRFYNDIKGFNRPQFSEGADGRVYVWSEWGRFGWTGTIGYWVHDGRTWENVDTVERLDYVQPRDDQVWLFHRDVSALKGGQHITGERAQRLLCPNLRFRAARPICAGASGTLFVSLDDVTQVEPLLKERCRGLALPTSGRAIDLGGDAALFFGRIGAHPVAAGPDGWIWGGCREGLEAMSPDGRQIMPFPVTRRFALISVKAAGPNRAVYLLGGGRWWRFDASREAATTDQGPRLPAMVVQVQDCAFPDSLGRMWCTWNSRGSPTACFAGRTWKLFPEATADRGRGEPKGYVSAFRGADGAMIFEDSQHRFHLFDAEGWVTAGSAEELALKYPDRLPNALAWPPQPSLNFYHHLIKDAAGRIWWAHWFHAWGVVAGSSAVDAKAAAVRVGPGRERVLSVLYPIGDGTQVLAADEDGAAAVLAVRDGRVVSLGESPVRVDERPPSGWRRNVLRDRAGRVWVIDGRRSRAIGPDGKLAAEHEGWLTLEDREGGLWFQRTMSTERSIVRLAPDGSQAVLPLPDFANSSFAEAPDGTVWTLTLSELIRLRADGSTLSIIERYPVPVGGWDHVWCDAAGRVWMLHRLQKRYDELIRFATRP